MSRNILSVEDDHAAFHLLQIAFRELSLEFQLHRVESGQEALQFLQRSGPFEGAPRPDLVLLNLNLPRMSGMEILAAMQRDDQLKSIPVVVFTSSNLNRERAQCFALGAKHFITKPSDYDGMLDAIKEACSFAGDPSSGGRTMETRP